MKVEERLLKYVGYHTTSDEASDKIPSSDREFALARELESELKELGLSKVVLTDHCYVYGLLPATAGMEHKKAVGFIAHMDTAPDFSGENVKPQLLRHYDGSDVLLRGSGEYLRVNDFPELKALTGRTLITTDGTTLLGADDKAGVAEIMTALEQIIAEGTPHGDIWVGFTPDEEVGKGADLFDLDYFEADFAYTVDGDYEGEVAYENFNAASAVFTIKGVNVHPGEAKDIMVNAALVGCEIAAALPANETPATTEGREGFYHLCDMSGDVASAHHERKPAHLNIHQLPHAKKLRQLVHGLFVFPVIHIVNAFIQIQAVAGRQIPPQLIFLTHDDGKASLELIFPFPGHKAIHQNLPGCRIQNTGQKL